MDEREKVAKGAKLMDKILPGWHNQVNLDKLEMESGAMCLLGQTFGVHHERSLAKEMYPREFEEAVSKMSVESGCDYQSMYRDRGYHMATGQLIGSTKRSQGRGGLVAKIANKLGLTDSATAAEAEALFAVCAGHDTKCEWAEEIAARRAAEGSKE